MFLALVAGLVFMHFYQLFLTKCCYFDCCFTLVYFFESIDYIA